MQNAHRFGIRAIAAEQRDVRAVQRGDNRRDVGDVARRGGPGRGQNLTRQVRRRGVWNRVVGVHDVEVLVARHLHDFVRERQQILRLAEQRIRGRLDAVKREPGLIAAEPERRVAAQNVDVVPARRERLPELGRDDAAAPDRCVTDNAHSHVLVNSLNSVWRTTGSRTTMPSAQVTPACAPNWASRLSINCLNNGLLRRVPTAFGPG